MWPGSWVAQGCVCHREASLPTHCSESTGAWVWRRKLTCLQVAGIWMHGVGLGPCVPYLFLAELCWVALADSVSQPKGGLFPRASGSHCCFLAHHYESQILFWPRSSSAMTVAATIPFYKWKQTQGISQNLMKKPSEAFLFHNLFLHRRKKKDKLPRITARKWKDGTGKALPSEKFIKCTHTSSQQSDHTHSSSDL